MTKVRVQLRVEQLARYLRRTSRTKSQLARELGVTGRVVRRWFNGEVDPSPPSRRKLLEMTHLDFDELFLEIAEEAKSA